MRKGQRTKKNADYRYRHCKGCKRTQPIQHFLRMSDTCKKCITADQRKLDDRFKAIKDAKLWPVPHNSE